MEGEDESGGHLSFLLSLQVNSGSQMASGTAQDELRLKAWCCESLAFYKRSLARRRPPESHSAFRKLQSERTHRSKQLFPVAHELTTVQCA